MNAEVPFEQCEARLIRAGLTAPRLRTQKGDGSFLLSPNYIDNLLRGDVSKFMCNGYVFFQQGTKDPKDPDIIRKSSIQVWTGYMGARVENTPNLRPRYNVISHFLPGILAELPNDELFLRVRADRTIYASTDAYYNNHNPKLPIELLVEQAVQWAEQIAVDQ